MIMYNNQLLYECIHYMWYVISIQCIGAFDSFNHLKNLFKTFRFTLLNDFKCGTICRNPLPNDTDGDA